MKAAAIRSDAAPASAVRARRRRRPRVTVEPICAGCQFSDVHFETRARCEHPDAALHGAILFAGQPACADFVPRIGDDCTLSLFRVSR